jgi:CBS domain-containing protein
MSIKAILQSRDHDVISVTSDTSVADAVALLAERRIGALPVVDNGEVRGIFSERDVIYGLSREGPSILSKKVAEVMITPAITVGPDAGAIDSLSLMTMRRIRHLPVLDGGKLIGFVSIGDIVKYRIDRIEAEAASLREYIQSS